LRRVVGVRTRFHFPSSYFGNFAINPAEVGATRPSNPPPRYDQTETGE
jgi:hypothetical protein